MEKRANKKLAKAIFPDQNRFLSTGPVTIGKVKFQMILAVIKRGCQHPSNKFEILWQVALSSFSLLLLYFVAQYVLIIVV